MKKLTKAVAIAVLTFSIGTACLLTGEGGMTPERAHAEVVLAVQDLEDAAAAFPEEAVLAKILEASKVLEVSLAAYASEGGDPSTVLAALTVVETLADSYRDAEDLKVYVLLVDMTVRRVRAGLTE